MPSPSRKRQVSASAETPDRKMAAVGGRRRLAGEATNPTNNYDTEDDVNDVIANLALPEPRIQVAIDHANEKTAGNQGVQAYAKLAGSTWTYYVQTLRIIIGRSSEDTTPSEVDIDLGPAKVVSRRHASIQYNSQDRYWELTVLGRNGVRIDKVPHKTGTVRLYSGNVLDVGGVQMMFVLPDARPVIAASIRRSIERAKALMGQQMRGVAGAPAERTPGAGYHRHSRTLSHDIKADDSAPVMQPPAVTGPPLHIQTVQSVQTTGATQTSGTIAYPRGVAMISRPQIRGVANSNQYMDQDLSLDDAKDIKPPYSYATMISQAILSREDQMMSLADIYDWISKQYAFYRHSKSGWQNSIRHNLSLNKAFEKVPRKQNEPGKGSKWQITPKYREEFIKKAMQGKHIKGVSRAVPRQNQLQLKGIYDPQPTQALGQIQPPTAGQQHASDVDASGVVRQSVPVSSSLPAIRTKPEDLTEFETPLKSGVAMERNGSDFMTVGSPVSSPGYPTQIVAYTPDRGMTKPSRSLPNRSSSAVDNNSANNSGAAGEPSRAIAGQAVATEVPPPPPSGLGITPARQASLQLAPPSSAQQRELPSSFMPGSSPAPFWKLMQLSTPVRANDYSPSKFSSPPVTSQGERRDGEEALGDLHDVDLAR